MKALVKNIIPVKWQAIIRSWLLRRRLRKFPQHLVEHCYCGYRLNISLQDELATGWYDHDWPSMPEIGFLRGSWLKPRATIFDIWAHQEVVALALARAVGESGLVVAVEGTRHNAEVARENYRFNHIQNIQVLYAIGAGAVVTKNIAAGEIWQGIAARQIGQRDA